MLGGLGTPPPPSQWGRAHKRTCQSVVTEPASPLAVFATPCGPTATCTLFTPCSLETLNNCPTRTQQPLWPSSSNPTSTPSVSRDSELLSPFP